eukprot:SAG31_NODE_34437_length_333_cov_0.611111_1_plen_31_part_01
MECKPPFTLGETWSKGRDAAGHIAVLAFVQQ